MVNFARGAPSANATRLSSSGPIRRPVSGPIAAIASLARRTTHGHRPSRLVRFRLARAAPSCHLAPTGAGRPDVLRGRGESGTRRHPVFRGMAPSPAGSRPAGHLHGRVYRSRQGAASKPRRTPPDHASRPQFNGRPARQPSGNLVILPRSEAPGQPVDRRGLPGLGGWP